MYPAVCILSPSVETRTHPLS
ncbi:hypothetical protein Nmel_000713, partial [Mimus melanotis]